MKRILLFGAGKSATSLISYLVRETASRGWHLTVADTNPSLAGSKIGVPSGNADAVAIQVEDEQARGTLVREADIVISLLPPALHFLVAQSCIHEKKHLLTASYLDDKLKSLGTAIRDNGLLFLCEMGLDPGIDHMSAMQLIHRIKKDNGKIHSFQSHTGGLVAPESDDNPWHYKISWNPRNVVMAGSAGARYKENNQLISRQYGDLFGDCRELEVEGIRLAWYPNRDSLSYIPIYGLEDAETFIRTTLRYPGYCRAWKSIVAAGLTDDQLTVRRRDDVLSFARWSAPVIPLINNDNREQLEFLGLFDPSPVPSGAKTSADILQFLLETKLAMRPGDKDMIVMLHEIGYTLPASATGSPQASTGVPSSTSGPAQASPQAPSTRASSQNDAPQASPAPALHKISSSLVVKGQDSLQTAMAATVGLPLGIAALLILEGKIGLTGLHIPILPEIYEPVLQELASQGIRFKETMG
ncbi:MAG TPA: saccharopine dehydrogenase C-terminal domain-containing protein [Puia sp.]|nr:saccharopine dehydrogenase C-terminal domain-containing protein [Puia sp.]